MAAQRAAWLLTVLIGAGAWAQSAGQETITVTADVPPWVSLTADNQVVLPVAAEAPVATGLFRSAEDTQWNNDRLPNDGIATVDLDTNCYTRVNIQGNGPLRHENGVNTLPTQWGIMRRGTFWGGKYVGYVYQNEAYNGRFNGQWYNAAQFPFLAQYLGPGLATWWCRASVTRNGVNDLAGTYHCGLVFTVVAAQADPMKN